MAAIHAGFRIFYREAHVLFEDLPLASATNERSAAIAAYSEIPLLIIDDLGMRKLPANAAENLLEIVMRRYERASTILTSNRARRRMRRFSLSATSATR
jgi:DNA replication protein DnaC